MDDKVYTPEIVPETPFPGEPAVDMPTQTQPAGTFVPTTTKPKAFPVKRTAVELLSTALNTRSRKILEEFELQQSGGLKVGDFKTGISGDLRITPNGLTARDKAGLTTFAIDGTTGDAVFKGTIRSGSVITDAIISGTITLGGTNNEDGILTIFDAAGELQLQADSTQFILRDATIAGAQAVVIKVPTGEGFAYFHDIRIGGTAGGHALGVDGVFRFFIGTSQKVLISDEGILLQNDFPLTIHGTSTPTAPSDNNAKLYVDQSAGKDRLMVIFNTGASQQIAIEP